MLRICGAVVCGVIAWVMVCSIVSVLILLPVNPERIAWQFIAGIVSSAIAAIAVVGPLMHRISPRTNGEREWIGVMDLVLLSMLFNVWLVFGLRVDIPGGAWPVMVWQVAAAIPLVHGYRERWGW